MKFLICLIACGFAAQVFAAPPAAHECIQRLLAKALPAGLKVEVIYDPEKGRPGFGLFEQSQIERDQDPLPVAHIFFGLPSSDEAGSREVSYNLSVNATHRNLGLGTHLVALTLNAAMHSLGSAQVKNSLEKLNLQVFVQSMISFLKIDCPPLRDAEVPTNDPIYSKLMRPVIERGAAPVPGDACTVPILSRLPWYELYRKTPAGKILSKLGYHLSELDIFIEPENSRHPIVVLETSLPEPPEHSITRIFLPNGQVLQQRRRTSDGAIFIQPAESAP